MDLGSDCDVDYSAKGVYHLPTHDELLNPLLEAYLEQSWVAKSFVIWLESFDQ